MGVPVASELKFSSCCKLLGYGAEARSKGGTWGAVRGERQPFPALLRTDRVRDRGQHFLIDASQVQQAGKTRKVLYLTWQQNRGELVTKPALCETTPSLLYFLTGAAAPGCPQYCVRRWRCVA
jgi:hypothetical protein